MIESNTRRASSFIIHQLPSFRSGFFFFLCECVCVILVTWILRMEQLSFVEGHVNLRTSIEPIMIHHQCRCQPSYPYRICIIIIVIWHFSANFARIGAIVNVNEETRLRRGRRWRKKLCIRMMNGLSVGGIFGISHASEINSTVCARKHTS